MTNAIGGLGLKLATSRTAFKAIRFTKQFAPEILTTVGVTGMVVGAVLAAKATLKLEPVEDRLNDDIAQINDDKRLNDDTKVVKEKTGAYTRAVLGIGRIYGPSAGVIIGSGVCIISAHGILRRRNLALVAAYQVLEKSYSAYRARVVEEFGEEKDREYVTGIRTESRKEGGK